MNRVLGYIIVITFALQIMVSCDNKENVSKIVFDEYESDYGELAEKYADMNFANCDEAIVAGNEIVSVYYQTAEKAFNENDAKAKSDLENFRELLADYDYALDSMRSNCLELFDEWEKENRGKINKILHKVDNMFDNQGDSICEEDVSSEIDAVNEQVEKLRIDIQQLVEKEDSTNM